MTQLERNFMRHAAPGACSVCGEWAMVVDDIMTLQCKCLSCCMKEQAAREERERRKKRIPLNLGDFTEL